MKIEASIVTQEGAINVVIDGESYVVDNSHPNYLQIKDAFVNKDAETFLDFYDVNQGMTKYVGSIHEGTTEGSVTFQNGEMSYGDTKLDNVVVERTVDLMREGFPFRHMMCFLDNLMSNPSKRSVDQLYSFLEHRSLPITEDGCFLAYKTVRSNYFDKYTGTIDNSIGNVVEVLRNTVDDNPDAHCSSGLHVGTLGYAGPGGWYNSQGDNVVIVKINPRDAVSVPSDHEFSKLRVCKYEVMSDYKKDLNNAVYDTSDEDFSDNDYFFEDEDRFEDHDVFADVSVSAYDLNIGEEIVCLYENKDGAIKNRVVCIEEFLHGSPVGMILIVRPLNGDPSYEQGLDQKRNFIVDRMTNIHYLER